MRDWLLGDWCFGSTKGAYSRARRNEARAARAVADAEEELAHQALPRLAGANAFLLGTLADGTPVRVSPREIGRHGMVWGSSGAGKSYGLHAISEGWVSSGNRLELIDPKGETYLLEVMAAAAGYLARPEHEREAFAARFRVFDVTPECVTPVDLWSVPHGMSPSLLASLRTAATCDVVQHAISDLMAYGMFLLFSVAIELGWGVTVRLARAFFLDEAFRGRVVAPKLTDERLRDSVMHLETTLPEQTRKAVLRQLDILLAPSPARVGYGLGPEMTRELLKKGPAPQVVLGNFGPSAQRPPVLARAMATNRLIDILTEASVRAEVVPELLLLEEVGVLLKHPAVAEYLLEASRTLRWKGLAIISVAQDPANAIPRETATALVLNAKWLLSFECGRSEAEWLLPHMPSTGQRESEVRRAFAAEMAKLPTQEAVFVRKGLPGFRLRMKDVRDPTKSTPRAVLLETFMREIAGRSMVRVADAEEQIARFESEVLQGSADRGPTRASGPVDAGAKPRGPASIDEFFAFLKRAREGGSDGA